MSAALVAYLLVASLLVAGAAQLADWSLSALNRPRRWAWLCAMLLTVLLGVAALFNRGEIMRPSPAVVQLSPEQLAVLLSAGDYAEISALPSVANRPPDQLASMLAAVGGALAPVSNTISSAADALADLAPFAGAGFVAFLWLVLSAAVLLLLVLVHMTFRRRMVQWPPERLFGIPVRVAPADGPAVIGIRRTEIVIPRWMLLRSESEQRMILEHEQEHVRARDPLVLTAGWAIMVLLPWNPAMWWMLSRLRLAVELDCDARVLGRGTSRRSYAELLIQLSERASGLPAGAAALADRTSHLERRLLAMDRKKLPFALLRGSVLAALAVGTVIVACDSRVPNTSPGEPRASALANQLGREMTSWMGDSVQRYFVDDKEIDADKVASGFLTPLSRFAKIEMRRDSSAGRTSALHLYTQQYLELPFAETAVLDSLNGGGSYAEKRLLAGDPDNVTRIERIDCDKLTGECARHITTVYDPLPDKKRITKEQLQASELAKGGAVVKGEPTRLLSGDRPANAVTKERQEVPGNKALPLRADTLVLYERAVTQLKQASEALRSKGDELADRSAGRAVEPGIKRVPSQGDTLKKAQLEEMRISKQARAAPPVEKKVSQDTTTSETYLKGRDDLVLRTTMRGVFDKEHSLMTPLEVPAALRRVLGDEAGRSALATSPKISGSGLTAEYMQSVTAGLALPMLVLDGVVFSQSYQQSPSTLSRLNETLRTSGVESLVFVGPEEAGKLYGARGARDGALLITTRK